MSKQFSPPEGTFRDGHVPGEGWMCIEYVRDGKATVLPFTGAIPDKAFADAWVRNLEQTAHMLMDSFTVYRLEGGEWETLYTWEKNGEFHAFG